MKVTEKKQNQKQEQNQKQNDFREDLVITNIRFFPVKNYKQGDSLHGFVTIEFNNVLVMSGIRLMYGKNGYFIAFPKTKIDDKYSIHFITDGNIRQTILDMVLELYQ